jgi:hypothetical protein
MPNQIENEKALIGSILQEPERVLALCQKKHLTKDIFKTVEWRNAYRGALFMLEKNQPIDSITLATLIKTTPSSLADCLENSIWTHAESYIDALLHSDTKRRLLEFPAKITEAIRQEKLPQDVISSTITELQEIQKASNEELFDVWKLSDISAYIPDPTNYLAGNGWLRRGAGTLITGGTGIGKSVLVQQIALNMASGTNILGCIGVKKAVKVLYVQAENDQDTIKRDVESIIKHITPAMDSPTIELNITICHVYGLSGDDFSSWLRRQCDKIHPDLIIIDPYQAYLPGNVDINSTACFLMWIRPINILIRDFDCALILVAHTPKPRDRDNWTARESVYMAAGSSAISNWARTSAELTQVDEDTGVYRLRFGKNCERTGIIDNNGSITRDLFISHSGSAQMPYWKVTESQEEPQKLTNIAKRIIKLATDQPSLSYSEIAKQLGCSKSTVSEWYPR